MPNNEDETVKTTPVEPSFHGFITYIAEDLSLLRAGIINPQQVGAGAKAIDTAIKLSKELRESQKFVAEMGKNARLLINGSVPSNDDEGEGA